MHAKAPDIQIALALFLADPTSPATRRKYREAVAALPPDPHIAAMTEAEQFTLFCDLYRNTPDAQKPELLRRATLISDCLAEEEE